MNALVDISGCYHVSDGNGWKNIWVGWGRRNHWGKKNYEEILTTPIVHDDKSENVLVCLWRAERNFNKNCLGCKIVLDFDYLRWEKVHSKNWLNQKWHKIFIITKNSLTLAARIGSPRLLAGPTKKAWNTNFQKFQLLCFGVRIILERQINLNSWLKLRLFVGLLPQEKNFLFTQISFLKNAVWNWQCESLTRDYDKKAKVFREWSKK